MKNLGKSISLIVISFFHLGVFSGELLDTYTAGDTVTTTTFDNIKTEINDNDGRIAVLESAPVAPAVFTEFYEGGTAPTASECANYNMWRANLEPAKYTCVQIVSTAGKGVTSCDSVEVPNLASAVQNGPSGPVENFIIDSVNWSVYSLVGIFIAGSMANATSCDEAGAAAIRGCITNLNWGGVGGATCGQASQKLSIIFR